MTMSSIPEVADFEKRLIIQILEKNKYNQHATARELKISRTTLWARMKLYKISLKRERFLLEDLKRVG